MKITHGMSDSGVYNSYVRMLDRTTNPNHPSYDKYGGAGIIVEEPSWLEPMPLGFLNFFKDMGNRPTGMTLDRIDNTLGYFKNNCKWSTRSEQQRNRENLKPRSECGSIYRGVYKARTAWAMKFDVGKDLNIPVQNMSFDTEMDAAIAYDNLYEKHCGRRPNGTDRVIVYPKYRSNGYVRKRRNKFAVIASVDGVQKTVQGGFDCKEDADAFLATYQQEQLLNRQGISWY